MDMLPEMPITTRDLLPDFQEDNQTSESEEAEQDIQISPSFASISDWETHWSDELEQRRSDRLSRRNE